MQLTTRFSKKATQIRSDSPLGRSQIMSVAPSIFAEGAHESRSARYTYIPTYRVLEGLGREGFLPYMAGQSVCRTEGKTEFTKHMVRLRHAGQTNGIGKANEIILVNSHDGSSGYQMLAGVFRFVCLNGLICGDQFEDFRVKHTGDVASNVIDAAFRVVDEFKGVDESVDEQRQIALSEPEQRLFANAAALLRFGEIEGQAGVSASPVSVEALLEARRPEDNSNSLWATFNRVQENAVRGGLAGRTVTGRAVQTRQIAGIDRNVSLNRALWSLAEGMRALKTQQRDVETLTPVAA